ncbi:type II toxin-antitoxin system RatA family toxin [Halopelagius fulvigenes]|uniref:Type II toxin-antitoxin system RatA family toxin n=1 Tax=Halopelagius fulvigenes TaxID=1198324 RepID=A0ABD5U0C4_9EURY
MDEIVVSTVVYVPPEEAYEFVVDFPRYANYSEHLERVETRRGDGSAGTRYALTFSWWKLDYTVVSEVTELDPPERVEWRIVKNFRARGRWRVEPLDELPADAPAYAETACRVYFEVSYDPRSAEGNVDLPRFVSLGWVIDKVSPKIESEAEEILERVVEDLEGRRRPVQLTVERRDT